MGSFEGWRALKGILEGPNDDDDDDNGNEETAP